MPRTTNITRYQCDRCGKAEYLSEGDPAAGDWRDIERITADNARNARLLCKECNAAYKKLTADQDAAFNKFMSGSEG